MLYSYIRNENLTRLTSPSPPTSFQYFTRDISTYECIGDERCCREPRDESTPFQSRDIRDDDLSEELKTARAQQGVRVYLILVWEDVRVSYGINDDSSSDSLHILSRSNYDIS